MAKLTLEHCVNYQVYSAKIQTEWYYNYNNYDSYNKYQCKKKLKSK